ncbi:hypothetical protein PIROE2DRAFT_2427, partial [Piromyces sp. E2]
MADYLDLVGNVSSIFSYCSKLNESFIRYKNHAKYLNDLALQLDSIYKLSENQTLLSEKEYNYTKDKNKESSNGVNPFANYKSEMESAIPPVIIHFYNYTKKFMSHVKKIKSKNFVERLWYLSINDEKMDGTQKDTSASTTNLNKDLSQTQSREESVGDKMKKKEREMKKKTREMQKREYELVKELEKLRRQNEKERKKRRELERTEEYKYYKDILENDEKLYKKMLVRVPITSDNTNNSLSASKSQNLESIENLE